jgi:hypothetical protein
MRAIVNGVESGLPLAEGGRELAVEELKVVLAKAAAADAGLVGDDHGRQPGRADSSDRLERIRIDVDLAPVGGIADVPAESPVPIEEYSPLDIHENR